MELNEIMLTSEEMEKVAEAVEAANSWSMAGVENAIALAQVRKLVAWLEEACPHGNRFAEREDGTLRRLRKLECSTCWIDLKTALEVNDGTE